MNSPTRIPTRIWRWLKSSHLLSIIAYMAVALIVTYPLIRSLGTDIYGKLSDDSALQIWVTWWRRYSLVNGIDYRHLTLSRAPFTTDHLKWFFRPGYTTLLALISIPLGPIAAYNLSILAGISLSGITAYFLAHRLIGSRPASFFAGLVFSLSPFALTHAQAHGGLTQQWVVPLFILALLRVYERRTIRSAVLLGITFVFALDVHGYYGYFAAISALTFALLTTIRTVRRDGWRAALDGRLAGLYGLAALTGLILYSPVLIPAIDTYLYGPDNPLRSELSLERSPAWFFAHSSRPWTYVIPHVLHPWWGEASTALYDWIEAIPQPDFTGPFFHRRYPDLDARWYWATSYSEKTDLYLGLLNIGLSIYALRHLWKHRHETRDDPQTRTLWYFVVLMIVALLFSQPPYLPLGGVLHAIWEPLYAINIPTPSLLTATFLEPLRAPSVFIVVINLCMAVLVAVGLKDIITRQTQTMRRGLLMVGAVALLTIDFANPSSIQAVPDSPVIRWLAQQPRDTIIMSYPRGSRVLAVYQTVHELATVDIPSSDPLPSNLGLIENSRIHDPSQPDTAGKLAALGADYALVKPDDFPTTFAGSGFELVQSDGIVDLYAITAEPVPLVVLSTFADELWQSDRGWTWQAPRHDIYIWNPYEEVLQIKLSGELIADDPPGLAMTRVLMPLRDEIIWSGTRIDHPLDREPYPSEAIDIPMAPGLFTISNIPIKTGETRLTLIWDVPPGTTDLPEIRDLQFFVDDPPAP